MRPPFLCSGIRSVGLQRPVFAAAGFRLAGHGLVAWRGLAASLGERRIILFRLGAGPVNIGTGRGLTHATIIVAAGASGILRTI
jgi:hypothetical protein